MSFLSSADISSIRKSQQINWSTVALHSNQQSKPQSKKNLHFVLLMCCIIALLNSSKCSPRWVWMPGFERWSTKRCRTQHLTHSKMPSCKSTHWCTGTRTPDSSHPTFTSCLFKAARVLPPNPSATPPLPTAFSSCSDSSRDDAGPVHHFCRTLLHSRTFQTFTQMSLVTAKSFFPFLPFCSSCHTCGFQKQENHYSRSDNKKKTTHRFWNYCAEKKS